MKEVENKGFEKEREIEKERGGQKRIGGEREREEGGEGRENRGAEKVYLCWDRRGKGDIGEGGEGRLDT